MSAPSIDSYLERLREATQAGAQKPAERDREVARFVKSYLEEVRGHLSELHATSLSGRVVNEANSDLMDRLVRRLYGLADESWLAGGGEIETAMCLVAVGGYARREMSIHSDIDLLVLYREPLTPYVAAMAERLQYWLWDSGLAVGCATRTVEDTLALARDEATVRTAVLSARFLCGDGEFFHEFVDALREEFLSDPGTFVAEQVRNLERRHVQFGESLFLLQPNVKEGAGGLRDYHAAYWVARATQPALRHLDDLLHFGFLTEAEMVEYRAALDFLWRVRNELHLEAGRRTDQMSFELQEQVAEAFGYGTRDPRAAELPVERFMRDYYRHARAIQNYSALVIEQCRARVSRDGSRGPVKEVEEGFRLAADHLEIPHARFLRERPVRLLGAFAVAQEHDVPLSRQALRLVRENLDLVDDAFRADPECARILLRILDAERRVMRSLIAMNETGLLGAYIPEWDHIVCRWQHVLYHTYTVDVHSIFLVEELRRLWQGKHEREFPDLTERMREVEDRPTLFLGCLLHDVGKGFGGDHSNRGADLARACLERLGLEPERAERVIFLVKHHLWMSHLAQRRDLSDAKLILDFARLCGDRENLRSLYLLSFADGRAASRETWTDWKEQLLRELYERTAEFLETQADDPDRAMELIEARVEVRQEAARAELLRQGVEATVIDAYFEGLPRRYFIAHRPKQIARHAQVVLAYEEKNPVSSAVREMRGDFTEFLICTRDVHGLYAKVAGTLTACGINILGSHVYTLRSGLALEVYRLTTPVGGSEERELVWSGLRKTLRAVLAGEADVAGLVSRRRRRVGRVQPPSHVAASVLVSNTESEFYTIVDVSANDRIGLLYDLTEVIARHDLEIYISKAATILDQVADTFYVKDAEGKKLRDPERLEALRADLLRALERKDGERIG